MFQRTNIGGIYHNNHLNLHKTPEAKTNFPNAKENFKRYYNNCADFKKYNGEEYR